MQKENYMGKYQTTVSERTENGEVRTSKRSPLEQQQQH